MSETFPKLRLYVDRAFWFLAAIIFIVFGFAVDGASEVGHHAGFILGGVAVGMGLSRSR